MNPKQRNNLLDEALTLHRNFQHDEAERIYARVRRECPRDFDAWFLSGALAFQRGGHLEKAVELLEKARKLKADSIECRLFLGMALADLSRFAEAEPHLSWALKKVQNKPEAWENLARCQEALGRPAEAVESMEKAAALQPDSATAQELLGEMVAQLAGFAKAEASFRRAVDLDPNMAVAWSNLGLSILDGRAAEAMECFDKALQIDPFLVEASTARAMGLMRLCKIEDSLDLHNSILWMEPQNARVQSARNMILNYLPDQDRRAVFESHKEFGRLFEDIEEPLFFNSTDPEKKLRVGFVSPDFRHHSVTFFIKPILANLDPEGVETILYHCHHTEDAMTTELRGIAGKWRNLNGINDDAAEEIVRKDAPDVLVDLAGHSALNRLPLFAHRLAPVQVTYLGYPNTTGLPAIGYRLVDGITDPEGADEFATEKLLRFSPCGWSYEPVAGAPEPSRPHDGGPVTFGSFNNLLKATPEVLRTWASILEAVPGSRLFLKSPYLSDSAVRESVMEKIRAAGIETTRIELSEFFESPIEHLAAYSRADVALDTFPYNGTTTTCEALWMGVPVVSLAGDRHAARVGLSLLTATGHSEWAVDSTEAYVEKAVELAKDLPLRTKLRQSLREDVKKSLLHDHKGQAERFESALRETWKAWCKDSSSGNLF
jgi:protein O-GlcNAc transferase